MSCQQPVFPFAPNYHSRIVSYNFFFSSCTWNLPKSMHKHVVSSLSFMNKCFQNPPFFVLKSFIFPCITTDILLRYKNTTSHEISKRKHSVFHFRRGLELSYFLLPFVCHGSTTIIHKPCLLKIQSAKPFFYPSSILLFVKMQKPLSKLQWSE